MMARNKPDQKTTRPVLHRRALVVIALCLGALALAVLYFGRPKSIELPYLTSRNVAVLDMDSGHFVAEVDGDAPHFPASLTKMMTMLIVLDDIEDGVLHWEDSYTVTENEANTRGSTYGMRPGEKFTVRELVAGGIMASGCDCIQCLVKMCAPNETAFVARMNDKVRELGLTGSHYANAVGIDDPDQYMTAKDVAILAKTLVEEHPEILEFTSVPSLTIGRRSFQNTHLLVGHDQRVKGLKTGTSQGGGFNLCTYAEQGESRYIVVLLDSSTGAARFSETETILDLLFGAS